MFARVHLVTGQRDQALVIPESALVASLDTFAVYVVEQGKARQRPVRIGVRLPGKAEILEGLAPGDEIVVSGLQKIVDGSPIKPVPPPTAPAGTNVASVTDAARP
jgi:membrane fusion protein (multidrug efflux system)